MGGSNDLLHDREFTTLMGLMSTIKLLKSTSQIKSNLFFLLLAPFALNAQTASAFTTPKWLESRLERFGTLDSQVLLENLKNSGRDYGPDLGSFCEDAAIQNFKSIFSEPKFRVLSGISYRRDMEKQITRATSGPLTREEKKAQEVLEASTKTIGELDAVVVDLEQSQVVLIGEVKCTERFKDRIKYAKQQMKRMSTYLSFAPALSFEMAEGRDSTIGNWFIRTAELESDDQQPAYVTIAPREEDHKRFDLNFSQTKPQFMALRNVIKQCQDSGDCRKPPEKRTVAFSRSLPNLRLLTETKAPDHLEEAHNLVP